MNKRILELAEQAGIAVWGDAVYMYHPSDTLDATVLAKFTELIVQECIDIVDDEGCGEGGSVRAIKSIQNRFGVEE